MIELTDANFDSEIQGASKPILVDFYAAWCTPCSLLSPILEKLSKDYEGKVIFVKANLDLIPNIAQKFGINQIPTVVLFKDAKPLSGFVGLQQEDIIKKWLDDILGKENQETDFEKAKDGYRVYAKTKGFNLNPDEAIHSRVVKGLLENEKKYGKRYCPCRRVTGEEKEDSKNICPCIYHLDELEKDGHCLCRLFYKN